MRRPPLWVWALPAAVALGLLIGLTLRAVVAVPPPAPAIRQSSGTVHSGPADSPRGIAVGVRDSVAKEREPDFVAWDEDEAVQVSDTLPSAPVFLTGDETLEWIDGAVATPGDSPPIRSPRPVDGPAQSLSREEALARPLIAAVRGRGRWSFYSAWVAPEGRTSLVGDWARVGSCEELLRLEYEQAVPGLGAVRGVGAAETSMGWDVALVVPRQHCSAATPRWRVPRRPGPEDRGLLASLLSPEPPLAVVAEGDRVWAASSRKAVFVRIVDGRATEAWSAAAPDGTIMRLLGVWSGDGLWAAIEPRGRVSRVWRIPM